MERGGWAGWRAMKGKQPVVNERAYRTAGKGTARYIPAEMDAKHQEGEGEAAPRFGLVCQWSRVGLARRLWCDTVLRGGRLG